MINFRTKIKMKHSQIPIRAKEKSNNQPPASVPDSNDDDFDASLAKELFGEDQPQNEPKDDPLDFWSKSDSKQVKASHHHLQYLRGLHHTALTVHRAGNHQQQLFKHIIGSSERASSLQERHNVSYHLGSVLAEFSSRKM